MLDADGATQIADMEKLEKGLDCLVDTYVRGRAIWMGGLYGWEGYMYMLRTVGMEGLYIKDSGDGRAIF